MGKRSVHITIDGDVWDLAMNRYRGQVSNMVEDFLRGVVNAPVPDMEDVDQQEIQDAKRMKSEQISKLKSELAALDAKEKELSKKREERATEQNRRARMAVEAWKANR